VVGVIVAVYVILSDVFRPEALPLPTVISPSTKPLTASLNVTVILNALFTGFGAAELILTVGTVAS
jgi:hypothetical protein